ncbi:methyltransferase family [Chlorella sorokiniana]|uniref:Methyltransferase family n=1 Tax=Chlorella sorokiniana TaxID=3076 RepID=A0A2P6TGB7_CHLSO|nr:methyltransferase family [Chlorella sorokiniana]|eukprot:PRW33145.1 methyltransferase family [Chlorella sorokiniana]
MQVVGGGDGAPPDIQVKAHVPAWAAACTSKPCRYMQLKSGSVNMDYPFSAEHGEDAWLVHNLFWEKRNGFYLEVGAMDGVSASNTLWLHKAANWTGMLVEADPDLAQALFEQRPESLTVNAAVCSDFKTVHWKGGGKTGGIVEFMSQKFKEEHHPDLGDISQLPQVACVPLQYLLGIWGVVEVDFLSIDVGGAELEVLQAADLSQMRVKVILVQTDGSNPSQDRAAAELLAAAGFEPVRKLNDPPASRMAQVSSVFVHKTAWPELAHSPAISEVVLE